MSRSPQYGERERRVVLDAYRAGAEFPQAAAAAGVSTSWAYGVIRAAGLVRRPVPTFNAPLIRQALDLYASGMACRAVAEELARRLAPAVGPSQQWVFERVRDAGILRSKSRAMELRAAAELGRDYDAIRAAALRLAEERRLSQKEIARELGVTHKVVGRVLPPELRLRGAAAQRRRVWESDLPDVEARLDRRAEVIYRRRELRQTYAQICAATGLSTATVGAYLRAEGLINPRQSAAARARWRRQRRAA